MFDPEEVQHTFLHGASFDRDYVGNRVTERATAVWRVPRLL